MEENNLRYKIIKCAYDLFAIRGIKNVTMDKISSELSISKRTLYEKFASKNDLVESVIVAMVEYMHKHQEEIVVSDISPVEKMLKMSPFKGEVSASEMLFVQDVMISYMSFFKETLESKLKHVINMKSTVIEEGIKAGYFIGDIDYEVVLGYFYNMKVNYMATLTIDELVERGKLTVLFMLKSISTKKGLEEIDKLMKLNNINILKK